MGVDEHPANIRPSSVAYDFFILILTLYAVLIVILLLFFDLAPATYNSLLGVDILISMVFLLDFGRQLFKVESKSAYLRRTGWLEFLGCIPGVPVLRFARLARLISVFHTLREKSFRQMLAELRRDRTGAAFLFGSMFGLIALTLVSVLVLAFERNAPGANIQNLADAMWWAIVTTATVGYGDFVPVTNYGRLLSIILMVFGVGIFGLLASSLATWFLSPQNSDQQAADKADIASLKKELANIRQELQQLRVELEVPPAGEPPDEPLD